MIVVLPNLCCTVIGNDAVDDAVATLDVAALDAAAPDATVPDAAVLGAALLDAAAPETAAEVADVAEDLDGTPAA